MARKGVTVTKSKEAERDATADMMEAQLETAEDRSAEDRPAEKKTAEDNLRRAPMPRDSSRKYKSLAKMKLSERLEQARRRYTLLSGQAKTWGEKFAQFEREARLREEDGVDEYERMPQRKKQKTDDSGKEDGGEEAS